MKLLGAALARRAQCQYAREAFAWRHSGRHDVRPVHAENQGTVIAQAGGMASPSARAEQHVYLEADVVHENGLAGDDDVRSPPREVRPTAAGIEQPEVEAG